ncbi:hypothetical protein [Streptomyces sp. NPDC059786]|uniref:hypothetical protein n=1 Tax=Streptomyces sp. NPDC059786 TaxID=3346946 RepID=UPI003669569F
MTANIPEPLLTYFAEREAQRADRVAAFLNGLSEYERHLIHDAAVMGYVQGLMRDRTEGVPKDSQTMALVIDACFAHPDRYPAVNAEFEDRRVTVEYFVQSRQDDDTWGDSSSATENLDFAAERLARRRELHPDIEHRLARRTTRVIVEAERAEEDS